MSYGQMSARSERVVKSDDTEVREFTDVWGTKDDVAASTDIGSFTLIALVKRLLQRWTTGVGIIANPVVGAHANAWSAAAVGIDGTSTALDAQYTPFVSAFGNASAATTITLQYSQNGVNYYDGPNQALGAAGDFRIDATVGARYARLKSSAAATITATLAGKS